MKPAALRAQMGEPLQEAMRAILALVPSFERILVAADATAPTALLAANQLQSVASGLSLAHVRVVLVYEQRAAEVAAGRKEEVTHGRPSSPPGAQGSGKTVRRAACGCHEDVRGRCSVDPCPRDAAGAVPGRVSDRERVARRSHCVIGCAFNVALGRKRRKGIRGEEGTSGRI